MEVSTNVQLALVGAFLVLAIAGIAISLILQECRSRELRRKFGDAESARARNEGGNRRNAEARLRARSRPVERLNGGPLRSE